MQKYCDVGYFKFTRCYSNKSKKSRDHTENIFKYLSVPIKIKKNKHVDEIKIKRPKNVEIF